MSTEPLSPQKRQDSRSHGKRLTEGQRRAIVAAVASGIPRRKVADQFDVNYNTVKIICKSVKAVTGSEFNRNWRQRLTDELPSQSLDTMALAINDRVDIHKAAQSAATLLKGVGVFAPDVQSQVNVLVSGVASLPRDWQEAYFSSTESTPGTPTSGALPDKADITEDD